MKHLTDQYYGGNRLKELAAPVEGGDAANKEYVDTALKQSGVHVYRSLTGTEAKTSSPYWCARWDVADPKVTEYFDGMLVCVKVPVAGNGSYGTALQINDLGYKPIVFALNSMITTRYPVGSVVWAVYNATQTATLYLGNGSQTITGCWQVMDYNSDTTNISNVRRYYSSRLKSTAVLLDYGLVFRKNETHVVPLHSVPAGSSGTDANTSSTSTSKTFTTESFDPFGGIYYYRESKRIDANATLGSATLFMQNGLIDARREFNVTNTTNADKNFIAEREIYLVVDLQSDGTVKLATEGNFLVNPWSQTLPVTNDGHLYILLGVAYDKYRYELLMNHPIYYHDGAMLRMYSGDKIPTKTSELDNDSGFITGPSASVEDNIPAFGNTSGNLAKDSDVSVRRLWEDVDVLSEMEVNSYYITVGTGLWAGSATTFHRIISVKDIRKVTITARTSRSAWYAFLRTYTAPSGTDIDTAPDYVSGYTTSKEVPAGETKSVVVPADANYLYVRQSTANYNDLPDYVKFTGIGITEHTGDGRGFVKDDGSVDNSEYLTSDDVSAVALSGDYDDLENTPTIPAEQVNSDWNATSGKAQILNKPTLFSGSYNDLADKPDLDATLYEAVTYSQLVTKISNSQLVKGRKYRITDYVTTTAQSDTSSAGHAFDLVVTAIDVNKLDCEASALLHSDDTYFSTAGADLSKWQIWYDVNNSTTKYAWADTTNGKGVIYRMIDEFNNDCPYDFKNILFKREITSSGKFDSSNGTLSWVYTFGRKYAGNLIDASLSGNLHGVAQNKIGSYGSYLNNIVFWGGGTSHNTLQTECRNITIGNDTYGYGSGCACNKFDSECYNITIGDYCSGNIFRSYTHNVNLANDTINKTIGYDSSNSIRIYNENDAVLPALTDNAGKVLAVNNNETGMEWVNQSGGDMLVCTFTFNSGSNVIGTMDKTQQQISEAVNSGKTVICKAGNDVLHLISLSPYTFNKVNSAASTTIYFDSENTWYYESITLQPTLIGSGSYQNIKTINNQNITGPGNIDTREILHYSAFGGEIQSGTVTTYIDGQHPNILTEIDTARNAGKIVMLSLTFGYEPTAVLFMPACYVSPVYYSFTGSILYDNKIYFISMTPLKDQNGDYVYENVGGTQALDWVLKVKSINAVTIYKGSSAPSSSTGSDGDIYIMTTT